MSKIEVITCITGAKDDLREDQNRGTAKFTAFTDDPTKKSSLWSFKPAYDRFKDNRRNSRIHKILVHKYSDADITIWIDGNKQLLMSPDELIERYLGDYDMAIYAHSMRDCIYDEAMVCAKLRLDDTEVIIEQAKYYEDREYAKHKGLCEGGFIIRKYNARTKAFNNSWWADYCRFSRRDQLSLMPAIEESKVRVNQIFEGWVLTEQGTAVRSGGGVQIHAHNHFEGNFNGQNK
jgi:hypothetical protein